MTPLFSRLLATLAYGLALAVNVEAQFFTAEQIAAAQAIENPPRAGTFWYLSDLADWRALPYPEDTVRTVLGIPLPTYVIDPGLHHGRDELFLFTVESNL